MLLNMILIVSEAQIFIMTVVMALLAILIYILLRKTLQKNVGNKKIKFQEIPIGFYIGASNIIVLFMMTFITNYCI